MKLNTDASTRDLSRKRSRYPFSWYHLAPEANHKNRTQLLPRESRGRIIASSLRFAITIARRSSTGV